ncbi:NAD(P)H-binding protein [Yeosuana sp.]|uniref:NAD(P)H-binding protein n=1 Tax=Yeosuana sp. TaxID=2529388 RepID=UPI00405532A8
MSKTAIIIGATGLSGNLLLKCLLEDKRYQSIKLFSRSSCNIKNSKIEEHLVDVLEIEKYENLFNADEVYCCIGSTKSKTPNEELYLNIDYGIPVALANLCIKKGITTFMVISALGANKKSNIFYNRMKGRMEEDVFRRKIKKLYILQPSLIGGTRTEKRTGEKLAKVFMKILTPLFLGPLKKYRTIHPQTIVNAMLWLANNKYESGRIPSNEIQKISNNL